MEKRGEIPQEGVYQRAKGVAVTDRDLLSIQALDE